MKKLILLGAMMFVLSGCSSMGGGDAMAPADAESAKAAIAAAKAAGKTAKAADNEWRDSGKFLKKAEEALGKKDYAKAVKMAKKAEFQYKMAAAQGESEKDAKPWLF